MSKKPMGDECIMLTLVLQNLSCVYTLKPPPVIKFSFPRVWVKILQNIFPRASGCGEITSACQDEPVAPGDLVRVGTHTLSVVTPGSSRAELRAREPGAVPPCGRHDFTREASPTADIRQGTRRMRILCFSN